MGQINQKYHHEAFSGLVLNVNRSDIEGSLTNEDITTGFEFFQAVVYCPPGILFKFYSFIDQLIMHHKDQRLDYK